MKRLVELSLWTLVVANAQQPAQQNAAETLIGMHEAWGPNASRTHRVVKESSRSGQIIRFRLIAGGVPKDEIYSIIAWPVTQKGPSEVLKGVMLDPSGVAICAGKPGTCGSADKPDDPIDLTLRPALGEPVRLGLVSANGATKVFAKMVPVPLRGEDQGCSIEATLLTPGAELVLIVGSGFAPNSEIAMDSKSDAERHGGKGKTDSGGRYASALMPYKQGVAGSTTEVTLKAGKCAPSVTVSWGQHN